jgi:CheY-like chemotaxis protein
MKVLLVDDSKSARYALRLQLQRYGITVETDDTAESALERIRETPPDAVFMDHTMPGMNGIEALDILKAAPATMHIPVVMCTSTENSELMAQAKKKGALDILSKSTAPEKLKNLLDRLQRVVTAASAPGAEKSPLYGATAETAQAPIGTLPPIDTLTEEQIDERVRTSTGSLMDGFEEHLINEVLPRAIEQHLDRDKRRIPTYPTRSPTLYLTAAGAALVGAASATLVFLLLS